ncbi:MAG: M16 family metallopeptidase [Prochlorotrichaceae cyanobacterium]
MPIPSLMLRRFLFRSLLTGFLVICSVFLIHQPSQANTPLSYENLEFPPLAEVQLPPYHREVFSNGLVVYLMEDHQLPLVDGTALIRVGDRWEPEETVGLAAITGTLLRTGGTEEHSVNEINDFLEQRAASIETSIENTQGTASFSALKEDLDPVLDLFAEILQRPAFEPDRLALLQQQTKGNIARRNDDPGDIAGREFNKLIYGAKSPYARTVEYATIDAIDRADVVDFYQRYIHPDRIILGIVGDFETEALLPKLKAKFGQWKPDLEDELPPLPAVQQAHRSEIFVVSQPQMTQSDVRIGHIGGIFKSPDYPPLSVLNEVLNGFGGRLYNQVRSRLGLAYSVYSYWAARYDYPGVFIAGGQTRTEATVPFIKAIYQEIDRVREAPIETKELQYAKDVVLNSFVFSFQTPAQVLSRLVRYDFYGYPKDFLFTYRDNIDAVTIADVQRVAQTYLKPEDFVTLVVGNLSPSTPDLAALSPTGSVEAIDITIPPPNS